MVQKEQLSCPSCGKAVSTGQKFCNYCGTKFSEVLCPACGKEIKFGQKFCTSCGTNINNAISTSNTQKISPQLEIPKSDIDFLKQAIEAKDKRATRDFLENYLSQVSNYDDTSRKKIYDLIGIIIKEDFEFFRRKIYSKFYDKAKNLLSYQLFDEMEKYLLEKYYFFKGEEILTSYKSKVIFNWNLKEIRGRLYITNQRIIALGRYLDNSGLSRSSQRTQSGHGLFEFPYMGGMRVWTSSGMLISGAGIDVVLPYGRKVKEISRTLIRVEEVKRKRKRIVYALKFEYDKKGKTKTESDKLKFELIKERGETKIDLEKRYDVLFSQMNEFMNSTLN